MSITVLTFSECNFYAAKIGGSLSRMGRELKLPRGFVKYRVKEVVGYFWKRILLDNTDKYSVSRENGLVEVVCLATRGSYSFEKMTKNSIHAIMKQLEREGGLGNRIKNYLIRCTGFK